MVINELDVNVVKDLLQVGISSEEAVDNNEQNSNEQVNLQGFNVSTQEGTGIQKDKGIGNPFIKDFTTLIIIDGVDNDLHQVATVFDHVNIEPFYEVSVGMDYVDFEDVVIDHQPNEDEVTEEEVSSGTGIVVFLDAPNAIQGSDHPSNGKGILLKIEED